ncbi:protease complex subunit PrcB family protein [Herpetosiphon giganteus]|uniref:protease complex subunit PrcB family protein n=1 Tax=Herpetosiphon giganteus TaxID=2029754 RepID=UPI00195A4584|nr:protease complex subunit PrcB family protein [Herpetosiphon giganteus]MBM7845460.1 hypothetical protein [Herpetosiphon giganteus]
MSMVSCGSATPKATPITFSSVIDFSNWEGTFAGQYAQSTPMCLLEPVDTADDSLEAMVNSQVRGEIQAKQQPNMLLLACFLGLRSQGGEAIVIRTITLEATTLFVYADISVPAPDTFTEGGTHSPVSIVQVQQAAMTQNTPLTLQLIDSATDQVLAINKTILP